MKQTIKAGQLIMCVDSMGAEIISLKKGDKDIIWWGDAEYWGEHCPTLFPCIGGNSGGVLRLGGKEYNLKKHGFAKGMEFTLEEATVSPTRSAPRKKPCRPTPSPSASSSPTSWRATRCT